MRSITRPEILAQTLVLLVSACGSERVSDKDGRDAALPNDAAVLGDAVSSQVDAGAVDAASLDDATSAADAAPTDGGSGPIRVGDPCATAASCPAGGSGSVVCLQDWPDGYCAVLDCAEHGHDCPDDPGLGGTAKTGGKCVLAPTATCLALCEGPDACREGYSCEARPDSAGHGTSDVCVPSGSL